MRPASPHNVSVDKLHFVCMFHQLIIHLVLPHNWHNNQFVLAATSIKQQPALKCQYNNNKKNCILQSQMFHLKASWLTLISCLYSKVTFSLSLGCFSLSHYWTGYGMVWICLSLVNILDLISLFSIHMCDLEFNMYVHVVLSLLLTNLVWFVIYDLSSVVKIYIDPSDM